MNRHSILRLALLLAAAGMVGCATSSRSLRPQDSARSILPLAANRSTGRLLVRVIGSGSDRGQRDIDYFVNGVRIVREDGDVQGWKGARLALDLSPGQYVVEARCKASRFASEGGGGRIVTRKPVEVFPGRTTELVADGRRDGRSRPEEEASYFRVVDAGSVRELRRAGHDAAAADAAPPVPSTYSSARVPVEMPPPRSDAAAMAALAIRPARDQIVIAPGSIVIHGDEVLANGWPLESGAPASAAPVTQAAGPAETAPGAAPASPPDVASVVLTSSEPPPNENLPAAAPSAGRRAAAEDAAPARLERSRPASVALDVESEPSGARLTLDDAVIGQTPMRLRLDPSLDHVLQFEHPGCLTHVRFISAASWERGRSSSVAVQLECR